MQNGITITENSPKTDSSGSTSDTRPETPTPAADRRTPGPRAGDEPGDNPPAGQDPRHVLEHVLEVAHLRGGPKLVVEVETLGGGVSPAGLGVALGVSVVLRHGPHPRGKDGLVFAILLAEYGTPKEHCFDRAVLGFFHKHLKTRNDQTLFLPLNCGDDDDTYPPNLRQIETLSL